MVAKPLMRAGAGCACARPEREGELPVPPERLRTWLELLASTFKKSRLDVKNILQNHSTLKPPNIWTVNILTFKTFLKCFTNLFLNVLQIFVENGHTGPVLSTY